MSMIFPGMDPYLENPQIWRSVHSRLMVYVADHLQPRLQPRYVATIEERVYVEGAGRAIYPDVWIEQSKRPRRSGAAAVAEVEEPLVVRASAPEIRETYIEILDLSTNQRVVTVIEIVSPAHKVSGPGRDLYLSKQQEILRSHVHLVEIDLLRAGPHVLAVPPTPLDGRKSFEYLVCVNRAIPPRLDYELYPHRLREPLPRFGIPLADEDPDVALDLQAVVVQAYDAGAYRQRIDYSRSCQPLLSAEDQAWANELVGRSTP